jgi:glycosyltransferase involved in cell wall biosynthesis
MTKVGIVIPCYNGERFLAATVQSVIDQTLTDWTMVISDDGSKDGSAALAEKLAASDPRIDARTQPNAGASAARGNGYAALPPTDYVYFLDADDVPDPTMLAEMTRYLDDHPEVGAVYCKYRLIDENNAPAGEPLPFTRYRPGFLGVPVQIRDDDPRAPFETIAAFMRAIPSTAIIRRSVFDQTDGWDRSIKYSCEDNDMFLQLSLTAPVHYLPRELLGYRRYSTSFSVQAKSLSLGEQELEAKWLSSDRLRPEWRRRSRQAIAFAKRVRALHRYQFAWYALWRGDLRNAGIDFLRGLRWSAVSLMLALSSLFPGGA